MKVITEQAGRLEKRLAVTSTIGRQAAGKQVPHRPADGKACRQADQHRGCQTGGWVDRYAGRQTSKKGVSDRRLGGQVCRQADQQTGS